MDTVSRSETIPTIAENSGLAWRMGMDLLSRCQSRLTVLIYHRVLPAPDPMQPDEMHVARFRTEMGWVRSVFNVLPLTDATLALASGSLPRRALCITFDDGYEDNLLHAAPVLRDLGLHATFFVTTRFAERGLMWNDRIVEALRCWPASSIDLDPFDLGRVPVGNFEDRRAIAGRIIARCKYLPEPERDVLTTRLSEQAGNVPPRLMMSAAQIRDLHALGMEIGGHTHSHPILRTLPDEVALREIETNKAALENITGTPLRLFAYPNGKPDVDYGRRHVEMVRAAGYTAAVCTAHGTAGSSHDRMQLPRFTPWDRTRLRYMAHLVQNYFRPGRCAASD